MARHKDSTWNLPEGTRTNSGAETHCWESIHAALLMDIRDEIKALNRTFNCGNFQQMPHTMKAVRANTTSIKRLLGDKKK